MGMLVSKSMEENFKKQQQFQLEAQRLQMERQLQMQQLMQERMMAMQIAKARDISYYFLVFTSGLGLMGIMLTVRKNNPVLLAPFFPLAFVSHYFYDLGSGDKMVRIRRYAENILVDKSEMVGLPRGPITFDEVEERRQQMKDQAK